MSLSDDARQAIAELIQRAETGLGSEPDRYALRDAATWLAAVMPDGRTVAQHLDDGAVALWECPDCAFTFDASHADTATGEHSCPVCELARLEADQVTVHTCGRDEVLGR